MARTIDAIGHSIAGDSKALPEEQRKAYIQFKIDQKWEVARAITAFVKKHNLNNNEARLLFEHMGLINENGESFHQGN